MIINKLSNDNFKKNRHKIDIALNNRHSPRGYWDEVKKYVRNVGYLGYIYVSRDESQKENAYNFDTGGSISENSFKVFGFSWSGSDLEDDLHFASLCL